MTSSRFSPALLQRVSEETAFEFEHAYLERELLTWFPRANPAPSATHRWLGSQHALAVRLQQGPSCGLVAMRMAAEFLAATPRSSSSSSSSTSLLEAAVAAGYSKLGEMFSAAQLAALGMQYYRGIECLVAPLRPRALLDALLAGALVLVTYDAAGNHEPYLGGGRNAHWALVKGVIVPDEAADANADDAQEASDAASSVPRVTVTHSFDSARLGRAIERAELRHYLDAERLWEALASDAAAQSPSASGASEQLYIVAQHGKSKRQCIWSFRQLYCSSWNLERVDPARASEWLVAPTLEALRGKMVVVRPSSDRSID